jgi:hypothetical protein
MRLASAALLAASLLAAPAARAQPATAAPGFWDRAAAAATDAADSLFGPFVDAWRWMTGALYGEVEAAEAHPLAFARTLRGDIGRFETQVGRAGFRLTQIDVQTGVIPAVTLSFAPAGPVTPEQAAALRAELAAMGGIGGAVEREILIGLLEVESRVAAIRPDGYRISQVSMALVAIFPEVTVSFARGQ